MFRGALGALRHVSSLVGSAAGIYTVAQSVANGPPADCMEEQHLRKSNRFATGVDLSAPFRPPRFLQVPGGHLSSGHADFVLGLVVDRPVMVPVDEYQRVQKKLKASREKVTRLTGKFHATSETGDQLVKTKQSLKKKRKAFAEQGSELEAVRSKLDAARAICPHARAEAKLVTATLAEKRAAQSLRESNAANAALAKARRQFEYDQECLDARRSTLEEREQNYEALVQELAETKRSLKLFKFKAYGNKKEAKGAFRKLGTATAQAAAAKERQAKAEELQEKAQRQKYAAANRACRERKKTTAVRGTVGVLKDQLDRMRVKHAQRGVQVEVLAANLQSAEVAKEEAMEASGQAAYKQHSIHDVDNSRHLDFQTKHLLRQLNRDGVLPKNQKAVIAHIAAYLKVDMPHLPSSFASYTERDNANVNEFAYVAQALDAAARDASSSGNTLLVANHSDGGSIGKHKYVGAHARCQTLTPNGTVVSELSLPLGCAVPINASAAGEAAANERLSQMLAVAKHPTLKDAREEGKGTERFARLANAQVSDSAIPAVGAAAILAKRAAIAHRRWDREDVYANLTKKYPSTVGLFVPVAESTHRDDDVDYRSTLQVGCAAHKFQNSVKKATDAGLKAHKLENKDAANIDLSSINDIGSFVVKDSTFATGRACFHAVLFDPWKHYGCAKDFVVFLNDECKVHPPTNTSTQMLLGIHAAAARDQGRYIASTQIDAAIYVLWPYISSYSTSEAWRKKQEQNVNGAHKVVIKVLGTSYGRSEFRASAMAGLLGESLLHQMTYLSTVAKFGVFINDFMKAVTKMIKEENAPALQKSIVDGDGIPLGSEIFTCFADPDYVKNASAMEVAKERAHLIKIGDSLGGLAASTNKQVVGPVCYILHAFKNELNHHFTEYRDGGRLHPDSMSEKQCELATFCRVDNNDEERNMAIMSESLLKGGHSLKDLGLVASAMRKRVGEASQKWEDTHLNLSTEQQAQWYAHTARNTKKIKTMFSDDHKAASAAQRSDRKAQAELEQQKDEAKYFGLVEVIEELSKLTSEGFKAESAKLLQNRGKTVALTYSKDILRKIGQVYKTFVCGDGKGGKTTVSKLEDKTATALGHKGTTMLQLDMKGGAKRTLEHQNFIVANLLTWARDKSRSPEQVRSHGMIQRDNSVMVESTATDALAAAATSTILQKQETNNSAQRKRAETSKRNATL